MLDFTSRYAGNVYSQNGESLIISEIVRRLGIVKGHAVEVGANDGYWMSNTAHLMELGWTGLYVEADFELYKRCVQNWSFTNQVRSQCSRVDGKNINAFVGHDCDVLSLDTDGSDYEIFDGLKAKPKIVIVEIDSGLNPDFASFNSDGGANYFAMTLLGITKGYFLLCHTGNLVLVANEYRELFPEIEGDGLSNSEMYFNRSWLKGEVAA